MPKVVDYEAKRKEIVAKAVSVLARDGLKEASLGKIASECGMGRTTLYEYFRNLGEVIDFALADAFDRMEAEAHVEIPGLDPVERILRFMNYLARVAITDREKMILVLDFLLHPGREIPGMVFNVQDHVRRLRGELALMLEQAVAQGGLRAMDPQSMAFTLFALIEAATVNAVFYQNISLENTMRDIALLVEGLRA